MPKAEMWPPDLRFQLRSQVDGCDQEPLAVTVRLEREKSSGELTFALSCDYEEAVGSLVWLAATPREIASRAPPYAVEEKHESLHIRLLDAERHQLLMPTWICAAGDEELAGFPIFVQARRGFLELRRAAGGWSGRIELEGEAMLSARPGTYRADLLPLTNEAEFARPALRVQTAQPARQVLPREMQLASDGDERFFARAYAEAALHYEASLQVYRDRTAESERNLLKISDLISQRNLLFKLTYCHFRNQDFVGMLDGLRNTVAIDSQLRVVPGLGFEELGPERFGRVLESWRQGLDHDLQKIDSVEQSQEFLEVLLLYFLDRGEHEYALEVSELARARAFADLLAAKRGGLVPPETLNVQEIRALVATRPGPVVEYFVASEFLAIFTVTVKGEIIYRSVNVARAELEATITGLRPLFEGDALVDDGSFRLLLRLLYSWLLEPIEDLLPASPEEPVTVVAHGQLHRLPFSALLFGPEREDWVVHRYSLMYLPSLAVLEHLSSPRENSTQPVLSAWVDPRPLPEGLPSVPFLSSLGDGIRSLVAGGNYREYRQEMASESRFKLEAGEASILVVASHAFAERSSAPSTAILLGSDGENDGYLEPVEIEGLSLAAQVVVLTACQTGRGVLKADGIQGLARSFFAAGARALVVTLWEVPAAISSEQTLLFLKIWLSGEKSQAASLHSAQAEMARIYRLQPRIWAGLILVG